jgi:molybdate transport system substrate-binding protein
VTTIAKETDMLPAPPSERRLIIGRRRLIQALPATAAILRAAPNARAVAIVPELALACDTTLGPAMRAAAAAFANTNSVRVNIFPTGPGLILPQLLRSVQNDIVVTQRATMNTAIQAGIVAPDAARGTWRNKLVLAARQGTQPAPNSPIAVSDPSPASDMDGPAILAQLNRPPAPILGVIDTDTVVALLLNGTAGTGLLHQTDIDAHPELESIASVPDEIAGPFTYAAAVTSLARRPDPAAFIAFLTSAQASAILTAHGLETNA